MSPQFQRKTHRARDHLLAIGRSVPGLWQMVDQLRAEHQDKWPEYTYLPLEAAGQIAAAVVAKSGETPTPRGITNLASQIATLSAWRMTQGIYRFDPAVYAALTDTPLDGELPVDLLHRLPEWCIYLETPDQETATPSGTTRVHGAYVWIDSPKDGGYDILTLLLDTERQLTPTHVPLVGTLDQSFDALLAEWQDAYDRGNATHLPPSDWSVHARQTIQPILSMVLYLCSQTVEISNRGRLDRQPGNPEPKRTRRHGWRLFAADGPTEWDVGVRMGAALRAAYQAEQTRQDPAPTGRHVRPHVRRAHWHTFLSGRRKRDDGTPIPASERRRDLRWLPPIAVNLDDIDELPATIRPIK